MISAEGGLSSTQSLKSMCVKFYHHDLSRGWSTITMISPYDGLPSHLSRRWSTITMISPEDGLPSPWSLHMMVYHHHDLSRGWSTITMISPEDGLPSPWSLQRMVYHHHDLSRGWSTITMISPEDGLSSPWFLYMMVYHHYDLSREGSVITMISPEDGLSSPWSLQKRVYHHHDLSRGSITNMISPEEGLSSTWSIQRLIFQSSLLPLPYRTPLPGWCLAAFTEQDGLYLDQDFLLVHGFDHFSHVRALLLQQLQLLSQHAHWEQRTVTQHLFCFVHGCPLHTAVSHSLFQTSKTFNKFLSYIHNIYIW